jgi:hypothetical protein
LPFDKNFLGFLKTKNEQIMVNGEVQLTIRNKGCSVTSRFSDEVVLVMVESGANSKMSKASSTAGPDVTLTLAVSL